MTLKILGVKVDNITLEETLNKVRDFLTSERQHYIVTTNPEFIMASQHDEEFKEILNRADLSVIDGFGIKLAGRWLGEKIKQRITGIDLLWHIAEMAAREGKSIYLLGARKGVPETAAWRLMEKYPGLKIVGAESGYRGWHRKLKDYKLAEMINRRRPDILFVAFGQVKQEKWISANLAKIPSVKLAMGVGGSFDYISGRVMRAPKLMRDLGLEWLFRLCRQPWRAPRIITAVVKFSLAVRKHYK